MSMTPADDAAHLLVVDDDSRIRALTSRYLGGQGYRVTTAENAADALAALDLLKPKIAVPMHYNTWPIIAQDPAAFAARAAPSGHTVRVLLPGQSMEG